MLSGAENSSSASELLPRHLAWCRKTARARCEIFTAATNSRPRQNSCGAEQALILDEGGR